MIVIRKCLLELEMNMRFSFIFQKPPPKEVIDEIGDGDKIESEGIINW